MVDGADAMNPDYSQLYRAFDLQPNCSLDAFRQAYRRYVASQHPDKASPDPDRDDPALPLPELMALYDQAIRFHRRHGRLPGAATVVAAHLPGWPATTPTAVVDPALIPTGTDRTLPSAARGRRWGLFLLALAALLLAISNWETHSLLAPAQQARLDAPALLPGPQNLPNTLALGMDRATVLAIQGQPVRQRGDEWEYGPSWIRFERGQLSDWYSSPFYRLKTTTPVPPPASD
jgi:hypothetical protein